MTGGINQVDGARLSSQKYTDRQLLSFLLFNQGLPANATGRDGMIAFRCC